MNPERDELVEIHVVVTLFLQFGHPLRRRPMNSHRDKFVRIRLITGLFEAAHHFRRHSVNAEGDEFIAIRDVQPSRANPRDKLRRHAMNAKCNQFVAV